MEIYTIQAEPAYDEIRRHGFYRPALSICMDNIDGYFGYRICYRWMIDRLYEKCGLPLEIEESLFEALRCCDDAAFQAGWKLKEEEGRFPSYVLPPSSVPHPVWGWQKICDRTDGKPDMRSWTTNEPEQVVRLQLDIPAERLLFSDFSYWHIPLNLGYFPPSIDTKEWEAEDDAFDKEVVAALSGDYPGIDGAHDLFSSKIDHVADPPCEPVLYGLQQRMLDSWRNCLVDVNDLGSKDNQVPFREDEWIQRETQCVFWEIREEDVVSVEKFTTRRSARY